jgi:hypothetical protein
MQYLTNLNGREKDMHITRVKEQHIDAGVSDALKEFLDKLFMKMPSLTFTALDYTNELVSQATYDDNSNRIEEAVWMKAIIAVNVYNGIETVGQIRVQKEVYRSNTKETVYSIYSDKHRLNNGRSGTKKTKDIKEALKRCLKVFVNSPEADMVKKSYDVMVGEVNNMRYWSARILSKVLDGEELNIIEYFQRVKNGETNVFMPSNIDSALNKDSVLRDLDTAKLAISVAEMLEVKEGILVGEVNGKIAVADLTNNTYRTIDSSYDLPEVYQAKFSILKIVDERQPVAHVGVKIHNRADDNVWYFLMNGDILTTC